MKTHILSFVLVLCSLACNAQNTNYGTSSGTGGSNNSFFGYFSGNATTGTGADNAYFGISSGRLNTTGVGNTGVGSYTLYNNTTGTNNVAIGIAALYLNTASNNVAVGSNSMNVNTTGSFNTGLGDRSLYNNTSGTRNVAGGYRAMYNNTTGFDNVTLGHQSMYSNTTGQNNSAVGNDAMYNNLLGIQNVALGYYALRGNTYGNYNSAIGATALVGNSTGIRNTAVGYGALGGSVTSDGNTAVGWQALFVNSGHYNTALGYSAGPTVSSLTNTTAIGYNSVVTASNEIRIGNASVTSIGGQVGWSTISDRRFKSNIKQDVPGLAFINELHPVSYDFDTKALTKFLGVPDSIMQKNEYLVIRQTGFIAQDVEAIVNKSGYTFYGVEKPETEKDHYSIRYADFVLPLVKAVQELSAKVETQQTILQNQANKIDSLVRMSAKAPEDAHDELSNGRANLMQNNPNPFNTDTEIKMELPKNAVKAEIIVYNMEGTQLKSIPVTSRGSTSVKILAGELKPGLYMYSLIVDGKAVDIKRMIVTN